MTNRVRQFLYLAIISALGLLVLLSTSNLFIRNDWVIPASVGLDTFLNGLISDLLISFVATMFLIIMAWLPDQMRGGIKVSAMLVAGIFMFEALIFFGSLVRFISDDPLYTSLVMGYKLRQFFVIGILPFVLIELVRRRMGR